MPILDLVLLVLLGALWGASYVFMRIAGPALGPISLMAVRVLIAAALLLVIARAVNQMPDFRARWRQFLVIGAIGNAIPFVLLGNAVLHLNASIASILNATVPLFTTTVAAVWIGEPLGPRKLLGAALGIAGVAALAGWSPLPVTPATLGATAQTLVAALCYGTTSVFARRYFGELTPLQAAVGQVSGACVLLTPLMLLAPPRLAPTWPVVLAVLALAIPCTVLGYLIYFRLIANAGPTKTSVVTFLIPPFGILWGVVFLDEPLNAGILVGLGIILASVWLVLGARR